jgi:NADPH:quinone reductase-like Zn-dependent oxidoreductase
VCSTGNVEQARSLGADDVIDYTCEDFTRSGRRYDLLFDNAGSKSWSACRRVLEPHATLVLVGAPKADPFLGPLRHVARKRIASLRGSQRLVFFIAKPNKPDLNVLRELVEADKVRPVVERRYALSDIADALRYMGEGHAKGKLVITV